MDDSPEPPLRLAILPVTPFQQNCTLVWCTKSMRAAYIDPGGDLEMLKRAAVKAGVIPEKILITHGHADHCGMAGVLARDFGLPIEGPHEDDRYWIAKLGEDGRKWALEAETFEPDRWLVNGDTVTIGEQVLDVIHCPGHTPGHVVFHHAPSKLAIVGDVLFAGSIGRTDFPLGNHQDLLDSITERLWPLGDETLFIPGHGPHSTFGQERASNPYVGDAAIAAG